MSLKIKSVKNKNMKEYSIHYHAVMKNNKNDIFRWIITIYTKCRMLNDRKIYKEKMLNEMLALSMFFTEKQIKRKEIEILIQKKH